MHARLDAGRVQILTRRGNDWTEKYPAIAKSIAGLPARNAYLDGELCGVLANVIGNGEINEITEQDFLAVGSRYSEWYPEAPYGRWLKLTMPARC